MSDYHVTSLARRQARDMGIGVGRGGNGVRQLLEHMAHYSAVATHAAGNRRYGGFILQIDGHCVQSIAKDNPDEPICLDCLGIKRQFMMDGDTKITVPCQSCFRSEI